MRVVSVTPNANDVVASVKSYGLAVNRPPAKGAQYFMVRLALHYVGGGKGDTNAVLGLLYAVGKHKASYSSGQDYCGTIPNPVRFEVFSGQSVVGNECWEIASNDSSTLRHFVGNPDGYSTNGYSRRVWFALR